MEFPTHIELPGSVSAMELKRPTREMDQSFDPANPSAGMETCMCIITFPGVVPLGMGFKDNSTLKLLFLLKPQAKLCWVPVP